MFLKEQVCLISSSGGHFKELLFYSEEIRKKHKFFVVTNKNEQTKKHPLVKYYLPFNSRNPFLVLWEFILLFFIFLIERPKYIFSTGAGIAVIFARIGKFFGSKVVHVETMTRIDSISFSGEKIYDFADNFIVLWENMKKNIQKQNILVFPYLLIKLKTTKKSKKSS